MGSISNSDVVEQVLHVEKWDLKVKQNGKRHHTEKFHDLRERNRLVVRRGENIECEIVFNRPLKKHDKVSIVWAIRDDSGAPWVRSAQAVPLTLKKPSDPKPGEWYAYVDKTEEDGKRVSVQLRSPSDCAVGKWMIGVDTMSKPGKVYKKLPYPVEKLYMLFNPWNRDDDVYLDGSEKERYEYVLEDHGCMKRVKRGAPKSWAYGQFEENVLECTMYLMNKVITKKKCDTSKAWRVCQQFAQVIRDDWGYSGLLKGDWSENHKAHIWMGSAKILQKYVKSGYNRVGDAQCWVFAGVLTTLCRAVGIPCRPVTTLSSAVDSDASLTVDTFFDPYGEKVYKKSLPRDSIWNYHVWCEAHMRRPYLGGVSTGWQVVDATYGTGPIPVKAIKEGEFDENLTKTGMRIRDMVYLYSEVNADILHWKFEPQTGFTKLKSFPANRTHGNVYTKIVGKNDVVDIKDNYKHTEVGAPIKAVLHIRNDNQEKKRSVKGFLRLYSTNYTGEWLARVENVEINLQLKPKEEKPIELELPYNKYSQIMGDDGSFEVAAMVKVEGEGTHQEYYDHIPFQLGKPEVQLAVSGSKAEWEPFVPVKGTVSLKNPLPVPLSQCVFYLDAPGCSGYQRKIPLEQPIQPGEVGTAEFEIIPELSNDRAIIAKFESKELKDADGEIVIKVASESDNEIML